MDQKTMMTRFSIICIMLMHSRPVFSVATFDRSLYVIHFLDLSTDRDSTVGQVIHVSSLTDTKIRIEVPSINFVDHVVLDSNSNPPRTYTKYIDKDLGVIRGESVSQNAMLVVSNGEPIWIQVNKMEQGTTAGFLALPVTQTSTEYYIPSYSNTNNVFHTGFSVAGLDDGTCLEVYKVNGNTYERIHLVHLDSLDVFTMTSNEVGDDFTGYYINSTKPITANGGHECAYIPNGKAHCDGIDEQLMPVSEYGTEFIIAPIVGRGGKAGYEFRVIATEQTLIEYQRNSENLKSVTINRGQDFFSGKSNPSGDQRKSTIYLKCSKPCLVAQYNTGTDADSTSGSSKNDGKKTDPFMMIVPPLNHYDNNMRFTTLKHMNVGQSIDNSDFITIVCVYAVRSGMRLDGSPLSGTWTKVTGKPNYAYYTQPLSSGFHTLTHTDPAEMYMAWVYGHGSADFTGYGYMTGYKLFGAPMADVDGRYDVNEPLTTSGADQTTVPWQLGTWSDKYNQKELPQFSTMFWAEFHSILREDKESIGRQVCSNGFESFFSEQRLPRMGSHISNRIEAICGTSSRGSIIQLSTYNAWFWTEYTRGNLSFAMTLTGTSTMTFRDVVTCAAKLRDYTVESRNWPIVASETEVNNATFLLRQAQYMTDVDCRAVEMGHFTYNMYAFLNAGRQSWLCNGVSVEAFGNVVISSSTNPTYNYILVIMAILCSLHY